MMEFQSILFGKFEPELKKDEPEYFKDLQLDYLVERILEQVKEYQIYPYFYTLPGTKELISYRQQVERDMEADEVCTVVQSFCRSLKESRKLYNLSLKSKGEVAAATYHLQAATLYWDAVQKLCDELGKIQGLLHSEGMKQFATYVEKEIAMQRDQGFEEALRKANDFFLELSFSLSVDPDKLVVAEYNENAKTESRKDKGEPIKNYFEELTKLLGQEWNPSYAAMTDIFPDPLEMSYLENVLVGLLKRSKPKVFAEIHNFKEQFPDFYSKPLLRFEEEVQVYLSFRKFKRRTREMGYPMSIPEISEGQEFSGREVYDLALVWKQEFNDYEVISNQFSMKEHPCFFVVTGPNQGGKTTFARSMGQAVYFSLMGFSANAQWFAMPMLKGISTHFEAEETLQSNSGKLKEEINRFIPMMSRIHNRNHFLILND